MSPEQPVDHRHTVDMSSRRRRHSSGRGWVGDVRRTVTTSRRYHVEWQAYVLLAAAAVAVVPGGILLAHLHRRNGGLPEDREANQDRRGPS